MQKTHVDVLVRKESQGVLDITVDDDGNGIAEADLKTLFDRFYVISSGGRYAPVTGAGLCLCSEIAKAHDGKILCKSELGQGTRFEIQLPLTK